MKAVRRAIEFLKDQFGSKHPLADHKFETNGVDLFVERFGQLMSVSQGGQLAVRQLLQAHLRRIDRDDRGFPLRLYPFTRVDETRRRGLLTNCGALSRTVTVQTDNNRPRAQT